ncbi:unnamed protein product [marine sediment metagenome]|uniref:Uncharacterized protein n=1 Tax=marine sediment metagenome TaxID=412755 RepID=X1S6I8_9ZZZZ
MIRKFINMIGAALLGIEPEKLEALQVLLKGYRVRRGKHNSIIQGGPTAWTWEAAIDDTHHGARGADLHADSHARQHALSDALDHTGEITDTQHAVRGADLHADSHARAHSMVSAADHSAATLGDLLRAAAAGAWEVLAIGVDGQLLTVVGGQAAWTDAPAVAIHGNEKHDPDFYPLDGTEVLTAPISMHLMAVASEPEAVAGNEGKLYYLTPAAEGKGIIKQVMKNSTAAFELVQIGVST